MFASVAGLNHPSAVHAVCTGKSPGLASDIYWLLVDTRWTAPLIFPAIAVGLLINVPLLPPVESVAVRIVPSPRWKTALKLESHVLSGSEWSVVIDGSQ